MIKRNSFSDHVFVEQFSLVLNDIMCVSALADTWRGGGGEAR